MNDNNHPYQRLTPDCVIDAVESQGWLSDARILGLNSYENRVYQVGIEEGAPIIAKFYKFFMLILNIPTHELIVQSQFLV